MRTSQAKLPCHLSLQAQKVFLFAAFRCHAEIVAKLLNPWVLAQQQHVYNRLTSFSSAEGRQSSSRKPRHMLLSCSVDTVLGDVFADSTSAGSEGIMAQQRQGYADIRRRESSAHMAAYSTVRLSQTEEARQSAARSGPPVTCHAC